MLENSEIQQSAAMGKALNRNESTQRRRFRITEATPNVMRLKVRCLILLFGKLRLNEICNIRLIPPWGGGNEFRGFNGIGQLLNHI